MSDANDLTTEIAEVTESRQNERNFQNRGNGISETEGKAARVAAGEAGAERTMDAADDTDVRLGSGRRGSV